jgi:hypothetical protein
MKIGGNYEIHTATAPSTPFSPIELQQAQPTVAIRQTTYSKDQR